MRKRRWGAVVLAAVAVQGAAQTIQVSNQVNKENRTIAVTASDKVTVMADAASVHVGFIVYGPDSDAAYARGSKVSNAIVKSLTGAGVAEEAIESESQELSPVQQFQTDKWTPEQRAERQFELTQSWTVQTEAKDAAQVLDLAVKAGANQSGQIEWKLKDETAPEAQAAEKAMRRAREVAARMAAGLNARLGELVYASNQAQAAPVRPGVAGMAGMAKNMPAVPLAVNPRQIEKTATVYAVFAIE